MAWNSGSGWFGELGGEFYTFIRIILSVLVACICLSKYIIKGVTTGSVKGKQKKHCPALLLRSGAVARGFKFRKTGQSSNEPSSL